MNVLIGSGFRYWNAEAAYAARLAALLRQAGHGAWILAPAGSRNAEELAKRGLDPLTGMRPSVPNPLHWPMVLRQLRDLQTEHRIDVVDVCQPAEWPMHLWAARHPHQGGEAIAVVRTCGGAQAERRSWLNRRLYGAWTDAVIPSCGLIRDRLRDRLAVPENRLRTIYFPVDLPATQGSEHRRAARAELLRELAIQDPAFVMAVVGRIAPEKGHDRLLQALVSLRKRVPRAALLIVNKAYPSEAPHRERLERQVRELGLEPQVRWLGYRDDVRRVMSCVDVGVIPSVDSELNCRVAVEFFSVGTPVVAFPTGALPEVVEDGVSGLVTADKTPAALEKSLLQLVSDPSLRDRLGAGARLQAESRFAESDFLRATLDVFEQALRRRRG